MNYLITYPRSGNTALRYLVELLTHKPTNGVCGPKNPSDALQKPLIHKESIDYCLHKRHDFLGVNKSDMVFFIIRNPIEACIRHNEGPRGLSVEKMKKYLSGWMELLKTYDNFKGNKILFYYEDVVKISSSKSKEIYPDPQSNSENFHSDKFSNPELSELWRHIVNTYPELYKKYLYEYRK